ncbi:hypothetical protein POV27_02160 [Aureisphaera galaxeae]|uniref:hypothetical protein n=1 Tax=Aureisphaera galaxeae TaxID=1538023 RepID=UPI002350D9C0|nr:hypothetical protein [Aureisphaera galaxeae]MDC8002845.1 hypothetical protein [Aureisphaera galaxeae]
MSSENGNNDHKNKPRNDSGAIKLVQKDCQYFLRMHNRRLEQQLKALQKIEDKLLELRKDMKG